MPFGQEILLGQFSISIAQWIGALLIVVKLNEIKFRRVSLSILLGMLFLHIVHFYYAEFPFFVVRNILSIAFVFLAYRVIYTHGVSINYLLAGSILSAAVFFSQFIDLYDFHLLGKSPHGLMLNRNDYVFAQMVVILMLINSNLRGRLIIVSLLSLTIFLSGSRSTSLILVVLFLFHILAVLRINGFIRVMLLPAIVILSSLYVISNSRFSDLDKGDDKSLILRLAVAERALDLWQDRPVFGIGFGQFRPNSIEEQGIKLNTHNTYLQFLVESGLVGLLGLIGFIFYSLRSTQYFKELLAIYANLFVIDVLSSWAILIPILFILANVDLYNRSWSIRN